MKKNLTSRLLFTSLVLTFAAFSISGSQCARVNDRAMGINSNLQTQDNVTNCIKSCNDVAKAARIAENNAFHQAMQACGSDSICKAQASLQHEINMEQISTDQDACKDGCHEQGSGSGGQ